MLHRLRWILVRTCLVLGLIVIPAASLAAPTRPSATTPPLTLAPLSAIGGGIEAATSNGDFLYLGLPIGLAIIDMTDPTKPVHRSHLALNNVDGLLAMDVAGKYVYMSVQFARTAQYGLLVVDVSNPDQPKLLTSIGLGDDALDIHVVGTLLYLAGDSGLTIMDVSSPAHPVVLGQNGPSGDWHASSVKIVGQFAYASVRRCQDPLCGEASGTQIFDVSNSHNPQRVGDVHEGEIFSRLLDVAGVYGYVGTPIGTVEIYNISDPDHPAHVGTIPVPQDFPRNLYVVGTNVYLTSSTGMKIIDVSDPSHPVAESTLTLPDQPYTITLAGNRAYIMSSRRTFFAVDISNPKVPMLAGSYHPIGLVVGLAVSNNTAYIADGYGALRIVDITDPSQPTERGSVDTPFTPADEGELTIRPSVVVSNTTAYLTSYASGSAISATLQVIDAHDPSSPHQISALTMPGKPEALAIQGHFLYIADSSAFLRIIDISDATHPLLRGSVAASGRPQRLKVVGGKVYLVRRDAPSLTIVDVSDPDHPRLQGSVKSTYLVNDVDVVGTTAFVATSKEGLLIVDVSDPDHPHRIAQVATRGEDFRVRIQNNLAYVGHYLDDGSIQIVDVTDVAHPVVRGISQVVRGFSDLLMDGTHIYIAGYGGGLFTVDLVELPYSLFIPTIWNCRIQAC